MLSPSPVSLICALLLCLPLAVVFTITSPTTVTTAIIAPRDSPSTPISIPIPEDDESLLFAASRVNSRPIPRTGPRKVAFMFLTTSPLPFAPLWELFFAGANKSLYNIYVHADPTRIYDPPFSGVFSGRTIRSEPTQRLSPSLSSAARRLLAHALLDDPSNAVFALLSPSCVPLRSFRFTWATLARSKKSFIEIFENEIGSYDRWAARGPEAMLPESRLEDFRIGSQFWALTRKHARVVVRDRKLWAKYSLPCVDPDNCYPEENYFPTLLNKYDPNGCVRATLTHVDWAGRDDGHPRTYEAEEVCPELILGLRAARPRYGDEYFPDLLSPSSSDASLPESSNVSSETPVPKEDGNKRHDPFLFARKFAPETLEPLMSIARDVILSD